MAGGKAKGKQQPKASRLARARQRLGRTLGSAARLLLGASRGLALFFAAYSALSLLGSLRGYDANIWWVDLGRLPAAAGLLLQLGAAAALLAFCLRVPRKALWRTASAAVFVLFASAALENSLRVLELDRQGLISLGFPLPFSLFIAASFALLALAAAFGYRALPASGKQAAAAPAAASLLPALLTLALSGVLFPVGQLFCFGTTDYRADFDAVVIFGAQVHPDGTLSRSLANRVDKGIELYRQGRTPLLIMSGGTGVEGFNEAEAMAIYAVNRGVPYEAILLDTAGNSTELTVANTTALAKQHGLSRIGAVSSFYHLPRIKMLYGANGLDVLTVPATSAGEGPATARAAIREIPAWWWYWLKSAVVGL